MSRMRLEPDAVRVILSKLMDDIDYWACEGHEAEKALCYIAGATDMARLVINAIEELRRM